MKYRKWYLQTSNKNKAWNTTYNWNINFIYVKTLQAQNDTDYNLHKQFKSQEAKQEDLLYINIYAHYMLEGDIKVDVLYIYTWTHAHSQSTSVNWNGGGGGGGFASIVAVVSFKQMVFMPVVNAVVNRMCLIF